MKISRFLILFASIFTLSIASAFAGCDGWFSFSSNCEVKPVYCQNGECTITNGVDATAQAIKGQITTRPLSQYAQEVITYLLSFVSLVAVIYIIYGGFSVMIGAGDEEKMKKTKNIIIYVIVGIVLIWLSFGIVKWVIALVKPTPSAYLENIRATIARVLLPDAEAYTESSSDTFKEYKSQIKVALENLEAELRVNGSVTVGSLQNIKSLVQAGYDRLPDNSDYATINSTAKRAVDMYIDIAIGSPKSTQKVGDAISKTTAFIEGAKIGQVTGSISATPSEGNAPLTVSFLATNVVDPSGTTPGSNNYIWWIRENGGVRRELGRGPSLMYTFTQEGTYTINLDVISGSRNGKGKTDVLPLSISQNISIKPKLGEIVLLVNGVNVSNIESIKINPTLGKMGIILDATASRAIGNGNITKTSWKFGNGNEMGYEGKPIVERQVYGNQGTYPLELQIETNDGKKISKKLQLIVRDPSAVIQMDESPVHVGEPVHVSALSYFTSTNNNVEYSWQIQNDNNQKVLKSAAGKTLDYTFTAIGKYIITLNARSANGSIDSDSRTIVVESREPVVNLENPTPISKERPNTIVFNASKSYDPDTKSSNGLTYSWTIDGQKVDLNNVAENGAKGTITFPSVGNHTVSLTISNAFGKVSSVDKTFSVESILSVDMIATPQVAPIGTTMTFVARSESADFYEWNFGDGTPSVSGADKVVQHSFQKTGNYTINLTVSTKKGGKTNQTQKKVYITDTNNPYSIIDVSNSSNTAYEDMDVCGSSGAIVVNRSEPTLLSATKSVNIDGSTNNLTYTWNYFGKTKTTSTLSEKFGELGCFPVKLTVRSNKNGATSSSTQMIYLKNQAPELTSISTNIDATKKDSQKILVKVSANGASDKDGVITSYIWYYTTESDKEPQNVQITQKPEITFVLPNITEKYYFGVILEDNDGARTNSANDSTSEQIPLIITNQNGNIYLPLITLSTPQTTVIAGENVHFSATAKTIVGSDITGKSEYAWDFDGDGKIDQKATTSGVDHIYENSGNYTVKVRVTYNGVSNTKYQTIYVKNELKAAAHGYRLPNGNYYFLNSSEGIYDKALWKYSGGNIESLYSITMEPNTPINNGVIGSITISNNGSDINTANILASDIEEITSSGSDISYQTSPKATNDTIHLKNSSDKILLSMLGNPTTITRYAIDTNTSIDSDLDGIGDNDADNKNLPSYNDGSVFSLSDISPSRGREQTIKLTIYQGNTPIKSKTLRLVFDYIPESMSGSGDTLKTISSGSMSEFDRNKLDELASLIRSVDDTERLILMKSYNSLVENWDDTFAKSRTLIEIQSLVDESTIPADKKATISTVINDLLSGESQSTDDITLAARLISGLVSKSQNAQTLSEKLEAIISHPQSFEENLVLAKEIFEIVQKDSSIDDDTKKYIYNQLGVIKNGGGQNISQEAVQSPDSSGGTSGFLSFVAGVVKVFFLILGIIVLVILIGYAFYRISRKNSSIGFQDFLIDSVFHVGKGTQKSETTINTTAEVTGTKKEEIKEVQPEISIHPQNETIPTKSGSGVESMVDPMTVLELNSSINAVPPPVPNIPVSPPESLVIGEPISAKEEIKNIVIETPSTSSTSPNPSSNESIKSSPNADGKEHIETETASGIPDWLKMPEEIQKEDETKEVINETATTEDAFVQASDIPDWLKNPDTSIQETKETPSEQIEPTQPQILTEAKDVGPIIVTKDGDDTVEKGEDEPLPDWLVDSVKPTETTPVTIKKEPPKRKKPKKAEEKKEEIQKTNTPSGVNTDNIPDWLK